jgi:hypothetical protein
VSGIPVSLERSQRNWVASFLFLLELVGISPAIQIRKISEIREIREITAAFSKKTYLSLHKNVNFHQINVIFH